jgi:deazaflavin-dependent oxidoreductase (nitroreductase family)
MSDPNNFNQSLIDEFRANDGKVSGDFDGWPLVLVTTTGAKSGLARTSPVVHTTEGGDVIIIASKAGAPSHPDWYRNLKATPTVTVELPGETYQAEAIEATGEERDRLYAAQAEQMPNFAEYEKLTDRKIPVIRLKKK